MRAQFRAETTETSEAEAGHNRLDTACATLLTLTLTLALTLT